MTWRAVAVELRQQPAIQVREARLWWICSASVLLPEPIVPNENRNVAMKA